MLSNPLRRSRTPVDDVRRRLEDARSSLADSARGVRDAADKVADALDGSAGGKRAPLIGAGLAAALGLGYVIARRFGAGGKAKEREPAPASDSPEPVAATPEEVARQVQTEEVTAR